MCKSAAKDAQGVQVIRRGSRGARALSRIRHLQESPVGVRFLIEPPIGPMGRLNLTGIDE